MQTIVVLPWGHGQKSHTDRDWNRVLWANHMFFILWCSKESVTLRKDSGVRQKLIIASVLHKTIRYNITFPQDRRG